MNNFDPQTGARLTKVPAPINTRVMLYHPTREAIVVEGKGDTDQARVESANKEIAKKIKEGYSRTRFHGQHPHSFDEQRLDMQKRLADEGDKDAKAALEAKGLTGLAQSSEKA